MLGINTPKQPEASMIPGSMSLDAVELDAARYRWLKDEENKSILGIINDGHIISGGRADSEIDSAMAADKDLEMTSPTNEVERDAARYLWLKDEENNSSLGIINDGIIICGDDADSEIDAAMTADLEKALTLLRIGRDVVANALFDAIKPYIAKSEPEPLAWLVKNKVTGEIKFASPNEKSTSPEYWTDAFKAFALPQAAKPLSMDEMQAILDEWLQAELPLTINLIRLTEKALGVEL